MQHRLASVETKSTALTHLLRSLHWLPVKFRTDFRICVLTDRTLREKTYYLLSTFATSLPFCSLAFRKAIALSVVRVKTNAKARVSCSCARALWNNFPLSVHSAFSVATFRNFLNTHLFVTNTPDVLLML